MKPTSAKRNYAFNLIYTVSNILFPLVTFPYVARILNPEGIGLVQFVISFTQYFGIIAAFGIPIYGTKEIAKHGDNQIDLNRVFTELFLISVIIKAVFILIYIALIWSIQDLNRHQQLFMISLPILALEVINLDWCFNGLEKFSFIALRSIIIKVLAAIFLFLMVKSASDYKEYLSIMVFSFVGNYILNLTALPKLVSFTFKGLNFRKHLGHLALIFTTTFAATMYTRLDVVMLGFLSNDYETGLYTAALKLSKVAIPAVVAMGVVLIPRISKAFHESNWETEKRYIQRSFSFIALLAAPLGFGLCLLRVEFLELFAGKNFIPGHLAMSYSSFLPLAIGIGHLFSLQILVIHNISKGLVIAALGGLIFFFAGNYLLTPEFGAAGTAFVNICTEIIVTCIYFLFIPQIIRKVIPWKDLFHAFLSSLPFIGIIALFQMVSTSAFGILLFSSISCIIIYLAIQYLVFQNQFIGEAKDILLEKLSVNWK